MIRIRNREITRMSGAGKRRSGFCNGVLFSVLASSAAVLAGITGTDYVTVLAADNAEQNQVMTDDDSLKLAGGTSRDVDDVNIPDSQADDAGQVYDFKDNKTTGTVTVTKVWDDGLTNDEREIPDIKISTKKPTKSTLGYTVTFHGNGLKFADGSETNEIVLNSSGQIVSGMFKVPGNTGAAAAISWYNDKACKNRVEVSDDGIPQIALTRDLDLSIRAQKTTSDEVTMFLVTQSGGDECALTESNYSELLLSFSFSIFTFWPFWFFYSLLSDIFF